MTDEGTTGGGARPLENGRWLRCEWLQTGTLALLLATLFHFLGVHPGLGQGRSLFVLVLRGWQALRWDDDFWFAPYAPVLAVMLLLLALRRERQLVLRPWRTGWALMVGAVCLHGVGFCLRSPGISWLALVLGLAGVTAGGWGRSVLRCAVIPLLFLVLAWPLDTRDTALNLWLQRIAAVLTRALAWILRLPVERQGLDLVGPGLALRVAASCSGIGAVVSLSLVALGAASFVRWRWWKRLILVVLALPAAVLSNVLRLLALVVACRVWGQARVMDGWYPQAGEASLRGAISTEQVLGALILPVGALFLLIAFELLRKGEAPLECGT